MCINSSFQESHLSPNTQRYAKLNWERLNNMIEEMTHRERITATLARKETDRTPVSMWRHFFKNETSAEDLAEAMLGFQARFDWDFMKVNPRASYHAEAWGLETRYEEDLPPVTVSTPIQSPEDWLKLDALKPDYGVFGEHLKALDLIRQRLPSDVPFLMTVFNPISVAAKLTPSKSIFQSHLREHTEKVAYALDMITETFIAFSRACLERGASGIFFATTDWASSDYLSPEEYSKLCRPYDLKLLNSINAAGFNMLHVCGPHNFLSLLSDYPVHAFNWDARAPGNLSLAQGQLLLKEKVVVGGMSQGKGLIDNSPQQVTGEVIGLRTAMGTNGWILAPGCTFAPETPEANISAVRQSVEIEFEK